MTSYPASAAAEVGSPAISDAVAAATEAGSIKWNNLVYTLQSEGADIIVMSFGEAYFDLPELPDGGRRNPALDHYSHSRGMVDLRVTLAEYYGDRFGVEVDPEREIIITAGSKAAIHIAMMAVLNPGDEVLMHEPLWVSYPEQAKLCHAIPVQMPYTTGVRDVERYLTERTRLLVVNNPNNPRGSVFQAAELQYLSDLAHERGIYLLADEAYADFGREQGFVSAAAVDDDKSHTIVCNSLSKMLGISGWRIGFAISNAGFLDGFLKVNQHLVTCAPTILQQYVTDQFDVLVECVDPQIRSVVAKRAEVIGYLDDARLSYLDGDSTFYIFVSIAPSQLGSEEFCHRLLMEEGVSVVPGIGYGASCDAFVRVSVGTATLPKIRTGIDRIKSLIERTS